METQIITTLASVTPDRAWGFDIPNYFWFTSTSAAAFIIFSLAIVFGIKKYRPIAGFSLLIAFAFIVAAPLNLIDDLKQPGRLINFFLYGWGHFPTSPMKWGVLILMSYTGLIILTILTFYRPYFLKRMENSGAAGRMFYKILTLGRVSQNIDNKDNKILYFLAAAGIPLAMALEIYTGYIIGVVHAVPLWHTPLMPVLFLTSALVEGIGVLIILLIIFQKFFSEKMKVDRKMIESLANLLAWFILIELLVHVFWLSFAMPFNGSNKYILFKYFDLHLSKVVGEYIICYIIPAIIGLTLLRKSLFLVSLAAIASAVGGWMFRETLVIGGQELPKTVPGFMEYISPVFGPDSIMSVASNFAFVIAAISIFAVIFPWDEEMRDSYKGVQNG
ncbi:MULTISPECIES: NrfD/PsrC family molybdoenzyme membrane anchor subunit [unclassified Lebetimonas]|uniref:NrfD/PsrC family molybdoenzyme membrane anchor subunit n=1 Tax=unclassified Lebetimonas TaxID=2648158 RepID=UPI000465C07C|nr:MULTISPECIES: NrfD/PsrC family molybdoenzyme membrane anchor subunit [unclassified Lebetimonas]